MSFALETSPASDFQTDDIVIAGTINATVDDQPGDDSPGQTTVDQLPTADQPPSMIDEDEWWEEIELLGQLTEIEKERQEAVAELEELTEARKEAKKVVDGLMVKLQKVSAKLLEVMTGKKLPKREAKQDQPGVSSVAPSQDPDAWRKKPTAELLEGIKGIGKKKLEALVELAPTVGELEDLRGKCGGVFKSVLPKGFGEAAADAIEDALLEYTKTIPVPESDDPKDAEPQQQDDQDEDTRIRIEREIEIMRADAVEEQWSHDFCDPDEDEIILEGYQAFWAGDDFYKCPYSLDDVNKLELWCNGWVFAERRLHLKREAEEAKPQPAFDVDDI